MQQNGRLKYVMAGLCSLALSLLTLLAQGQQTITINMAPIDGVAINRDNIFNYQIQSSGSGNVMVTGTIRYRNSNISVSYSLNTTLRQGINTIAAVSAHPHWQFSSSALQELFFTYNILPFGTFEYCVTVTPVNAAQESIGGAFDECLYHRSDDFFVINLIDPINKSKLKDFNPALTWVANYSFSNELTYRLRIAEIKKGQNPVTAVMRNQAIYDDKNLLQNSMVYPVFAKPLKGNQPYAWTVDAYYKGVLLGGSETWEFIIPDDTLKDVKTPNRSYIDIKRENGTAVLNAIGELKIKYVLEKIRQDELSLKLTGSRNEEVRLKPERLMAVYGNNHYVLNLRDSCNLKHMTKYTLKVKSKTGEEYSLPFTYINPDYQK